MTDFITSLRGKFDQAGQDHVFAWWNELDGAARERLIAQAQEIDLEEIKGLVADLVHGNGAGALSFEGLEPAPYHRHPDHGGDAVLWAHMKSKGESALAEGQVAAFTVAGGQGTRLGFDGPKGTFPVTPVKGKMLFQVFAEKIIAAQNQYESTIPWFIMTSDVNHAATVTAFVDHAYWGLQPNQVQFFSQGRMPAVDEARKIILEGKDSIAMSPDGHGGSLRALVRSGALATMRRMGATIISYFQVDNPLVNFLDPAFIGFHLESESEMSSKMIPKAYAGEKVGHFCTQKGNTVVIEYSDLPESYQEERDASGDLRYLAGSIAIHLLSADFIGRLVEGNRAGMTLPFHLAHKKIKSLQPDGSIISPVAPNGYKFELFVFDALPFARNPVIIETKREDDFSPVKNADGVDSPASSKLDQMKQWMRWLSAVGVSVPVDSDGNPTIHFEISPIFADSEKALIEHWNQLEEKPEIVDGLYLGPLA